jgi:hypothetical protein
MGTTEDRHPAIVIIITIAIGAAKVPRGTSTDNKRVPVGAMPRARVRESGNRLRGRM